MPPFLPIDPIDYSNPVLVIYGRNVNYPTIIPTHQLFDTAE